MARKGIMLAALLIGGYLVLTHYKGFSSDTSSAASGSVNLVKAFQGR